ncbi:hypothetical protein KPSA1B_103800 [Pseudomonas syringae pv. actinidiae]|nr:hypothetical protein KPSA1B_103800 [Pseudomonas syringae pv. actinidiae]
MSVQTLGVRKNTIVPTLSAHRYTTLLLILAGGRGSDRGGDPHCSRRGRDSRRKCSA